MALAADAQRERTLGTLRRAYLEGRLGAEELDERTGRALAARTTRELRLLVLDLPFLADATAAVRAGARRALRLLVLFSVWSVVSVAVAVAFVVAVAADGWNGAELLVFPVLWLLATAGFRRAARRR